MPADPLEVFTARCRAKATLVIAGDIPLQDAVDDLWATGGEALAATIPTTWISLPPPDADNIQAQRHPHLYPTSVPHTGVDAVQAIMAEAFAGVPRYEPGGLEDAFEALAEELEAVARRGPSPGAPAPLGEYEGLSPSFAAACRKADAKAIAQGRRKPAPIRSVAIEGVASAGEMQAVQDAAILAERQRHGAAKSTVDALIYQIQRDGLAALQDEKLKQLSARQLREMINLLKKART
jgi:hypothetical protein